MAGPTAMVPTRMHRQSGGDHGLFTTSNVNVMMKQIMANHTPDGREFDVKPLLPVVENIMHHANLIKPGIALATTQAQVQALDEKALQSGFSDMLELLAYPINRIACEISCKCLGGSDAHATAVGLFNMLSSYMWDAKVVIALAAFAVNYGQFWLVAQLSPTNLLADSVALLKQLPVIEQADPLEPPDILKQADPLEALTKLIKAMLDMTKCIVEFKELPSLYITPETPALVTATAHIPTAVYWTIRSIVACGSQIMSLIDMGHEYESTTEAWELSSLAGMVSNIHSHLEMQLALCYQHIDEKRQAEAYQTLVRIVGMSHIDNMKVLKYLINDKEDQLPLWDGHSKRQVSLDVLRRKNVLLFISEPDLSYDKDLIILRAMYTASRQHPSRPESQYEIVWLPVVDRSTTSRWIEEMQIKSSKALMPWYSVYHPSLLYPPVIKYIKEVWHFNKTPLLVALDPQGNVVNTNAIHMMRIWGYRAFPFTTAREDGLWREATWNIELLADSIDPLISTWISEGKYICLYGGEDIEWLRKFTKTAKAVAQAARIPLEMLYVGKSYPWEKVRKNNTTIVADENLSHIWPNLHLIWFFWVRLESMWHSKTKHGKSIENDTIVQEIMAMLSFDGCNQGWAVISRGSAEMAKANGDTILKSLTQFQRWKEQAEQAGFVAALNQNLHDLHTLHHCSRIILPEATCGIPERVACAECGRPMEKFIMYCCCTDSGELPLFQFVHIYNTKMWKALILNDFRPQRITARKGGLRRNFQKFIMDRCYTD